MRVIAPYTERVTVSFQTDDEIPELKGGIDMAKNGDWDVAISFFDQATENHRDSDRVHKAYNLGLDCTYTDRFE